MLSTSTRGSVPAVPPATGPRDAIPALPVSSLQPLAGMLRWIVVAVLTIAVALPLGFILFQSLLSAPFFDANKTLGIDGFRFVFSDPDFWSAVKNSFIIAGGMLFISIPLGGILAFLMVRTDLPGRRWLEPLLLTPVFVSPMVLAFGYVVAAGPVGFYSVWFKALFGAQSVPWNVLRLRDHHDRRPHARAARVPVLVGRAAQPRLGRRGSRARDGRPPFRVALDVSLPMTMPALLFAGVLVFFLGFEVFGLPLVLGDPEGHLVLATYLQADQQARRAVVSPDGRGRGVHRRDHVPARAAAAPPAEDREPLRHREGQGRPRDGAAARRMALGRARDRRVWLMLTVIVPISGIVLRAFVTNWGEGVALAEVLTLSNFIELFEQDNLVRAIVNTLGIGVIGGALAIGFYSLVAFAGHRRPDWATKLLDYRCCCARCPACSPVSRSCGSSCSSRACAS